MSDRLTDAEGYTLVAIRLVDVEVLLEGYGDEMVSSDFSAYHRVREAFEAATDGDQ